MDTNPYLSSREFVTKLIQLVRVNTLLHFQKSRDAPYLSQKLKRDVWLSTAASLGIDPKLCLLKWKELVSRYESEKAALHEASKLKIREESTWPYFQMMTFLDTSILHQNRSLHSNTENVSLASLHAGTDDILHEPMEEQNPPTTTISQATISDYNLNNDHLSGSANMEAQNLIAAANNDVDVVSRLTLDETTTMAVVTPSTEQVYESQNGYIMRRIESLLEGLGATNRDLAEKRILTYLCHCQLKVLNNESIDDIQI